MTPALVFRTAELASRKRLVFAVASMDEWSCDKSGTVVSTMRTAKTEPFWLRDFVRLVGELTCFGPGRRVVVLKDSKARLG